MTDSKCKKNENAPPKTVADKTSESSTPTAPTFPPVEAAARRLDRLFGGGSSSNVATAAAADPQSLIQPAKIFRRWLGSSSGASGKATLSQVASCAERTLDPNGKCATGRELLVGLVTEEERNDVWRNFSSKGKDGDKPKAGEKTEKEKKVEDSKKKEEAMDEDETNNEPPPITYLVKSAREVESWLVSLAVRILWRAKKHQEAFEWTQKGLNVLDAHLSECSSSGGDVGGLYPLLARLLRYRSLALQSLSPATRSALTASLRPELAGRHTTAVLRRDADVQAVVLNVMLRDLLEGDQVEQAQKLLSNATFPTETATNNQLVRYLYYSGRVQALRLEYTRAYANLSQALRKSPSNAGLGFRIAAQRLLVVVQLLMGEIPDRSVFFGEGMTVELKPYLEIVQAVRRGDLAVFHATVSTHAERLRIDGTYTLISRLAHSVVKAGLRRLKASYSRISLADVASRLGLPSATSAEFVVAKAIRDGVIDATVDHEEGYVQSHDLVDVYATVEPSEAFHRRIAYCLTTHNDAVRAMRYTPDAYMRQLEASRGIGRRGRDDDNKTDEEKAKEIEDELDEDY
mmetsp:Transcript_3696/g.7746  ORF Transcript_3696/g.7746 Transcript_3696/m.7746 type:complete len:574 (-) Transcript_3696:177-1898(-)|eukprot:CAMPEP_0172553932 /NCGR_PEP_ID=MMETSP1067-20121228/52438_1 /TAXON_ID=265564 ORGANISM="Thalassiosira punctigera, Strain Tpunct2005C2" /NCGR_SAMPLE_ID=MMETSP1067 /ASSEMBLY_ACC=CAM_ASM_000444 /LENGTH=573 /DNA_ID=CAMNT_0013342209 /DNA_START=45 /DNA_END=1766 /DNA_ORIENTATION=+